MFSSLHNIPLARAAAQVARKQLLVCVMRHLHSRSSPLAAESAPCSAWQQSRRMTQRTGVGAACTAHAALTLPQQCPHHCQQEAAAPASSLCPRTRSSRLAAWPGPLPGPPGGVVSNSMHPQSRLPWMTGTCHAVSQTRRTRCHLRCRCAASWMMCQMRLLASWCRMQTATLVMQPELPAAAAGLHSKGST